jgi:Tfp pilus assembly protein PilX
MAGICKTTNRKGSGRQGFILIATVIVMSLLLFLSTYVISFSITELKISSSQSAATQAYYLAESGVAEAIWRIKNDSSWKNNFETSDNWNISYTRDPALYPNGSYRIDIQNTGLARGEITVTGYIRVGNSTAQRVIKTTVYKAIGDNPMEDISEYADGNIDMSGTVLKVFNGGIFSNGNVTTNFFSVINVDKALRATGNLVRNFTSSVIASLINTHNENPPAPAPLPMPAVSFDNPSDPNSYKSRADHVYTAQQFSDLLWNDTNLTLDGITYVTGDVSIKGTQNLTINGALVADGDITLGENTLLCCWNWRCGRSHIIMNKPATSSPSGLIAKGRVDFELCLDSLEGTGIIYANDKINVLSLPNKIAITGGMFSRKITLTSLWQGFEIIYDNDAIIYALGNPLFSPIVTVEHWEEEY